MILLVFLLLFPLIVDGHQFDLQVKYYQPHPDPPQVEQFPDVHIEEGETATSFVHRLLQGQVNMGGDDNKFVELDQHHLDPVHKKFLISNTPYRCFVVVVDDYNSDNNKHRPALCIADDNQPLKDALNKELAKSSPTAPSKTPVFILEIVNSLSHLLTLPSATPPPPIGSDEGLFALLSMASRDGYYKSLVYGWVVYPVVEWDGQEAIKVEEMKPYRPVNDAEAIMLPIHLTPKDGHPTTNSTYHHTKGRHRYILIMFFSKGEIWVLDPHALPYPKKGSDFEEFEEKILEVNKLVWDHELLLEKQGIAQVHMVMPYNPHLYPSPPVIKDEVDSWYVVTNWARLFIGKAEKYSYDPILMSDIMRKVLDECMEEVPDDKCEELKLDDCRRVEKNQDEINEMLQEAARAIESEVKKVEGTN